MRVTALYIHPFKSCRAVRVDHAEVTARGLAGDRRFMVVGEDRQFLSQRTHPEIGRPVVERVDAGLRLRHDGSTITVLEPEDARVVDVRVWDDDVAAIDCGDQAARWFGDLVGAPVRLVYMPDAVTRPTRAPDAQDVPVSFADACPFLLTNEASLADLNGRIEGTPVPMEAFRPNIVVDGEVPWAEVRWTRLRIGEVGFEVVKPCMRCKITTLDPDDPGRPRTDGEPLATLARVRQDERGGVVFGQNLVCRNPGGRVAVGDAVELG